MSQWYWSRNKKVFGPVERDEIISLIQDKKLLHLDMIYKDKTSGWMPLFQVEEFSSYLGDGKLPFNRGAIMEWILLKKVKIGKGIEYKQIGPFTVEQILNMLDSGELVFDDLVWKKDFESWVPISQLEDFKKPLPSSPVFDSSLYKTTGSQKDPDEEISLTGGNIDRYFHEPEMTSTAPINSENFVTESRMNPISSSKKIKENQRILRGNNDFYPLKSSRDSESLKLKDDKKQTDRKQVQEQTKEDQNKYQLRETDITDSRGKKKREVKKIKKTIDINKLNKLNNSKIKIFKMDIDTWQWVALIAAAISSIVFLYLLF